MTLLSVQNPDDALDIVQDAMLKLATRYGRKTPAEWPPLFYRVLKNRTTDYHRSKQSRSKLFGWFGGRDDAEDPIDATPAPRRSNPDRAFEMADFGPRLEAGLKQLPDRQREAFLLRVWEGLSVAETARAMGCAQGSVKTHHARALSALKAELGEFEHE